MLYFPVFLPICFAEFTEWRSTFLSGYFQVSRPFHTKHRKIKDSWDLLSSWQGDNALWGTCINCLLEITIFLKYLGILVSVYFKESFFLFIEGDHKEWHKEQGSTTAHKPTQEFSGLLVPPWAVGDVFCRVPDLLGGVWQERVPPGPQPVQQHPGVQDHGAGLPHHLHHRGGGRHRAGQRLGHLLHHLLWSAPRLVSLQQTKQSKTCWFLAFLCSKGHRLLQFSGN